MAQRDIRLIPAPNGAGPTHAPGLAGRWLGGLRQIATSPELRGIVRRVLDTDPIGTLPRRLWDASPGMQQTLLKRFGADAAVIYRPASSSSEELLPYYSEPGRVAIDKARADLGFGASVSLDQARDLTASWCRAAHLLP
jgi:hypothetical protein